MFSTVVPCLKIYFHIISNKRLRRVTHLQKCVKNKALLMHFSCKKPLGSKFPNLAHSELFMESG